MSVETGTFNNQPICGLDTTGDSAANHLQRLQEGGDRVDGTSQFEPKTEKVDVQEEEE